jgi:hypothetical protein
MQKDNGANHERGTVLCDAVYFAARDVLATPSGRRTMILITHGEDNGSRLSLKQAVEETQKADAIVYGILYLDREVYDRLPVGFYKGEAVLKQMAGKTGGRLFTEAGKNSLDSNCAINT